MSHLLRSTGPTMAKSISIFLLFFALSAAHVHHQKHLTRHNHQKARLHYRNAISEGFELYFNETSQLIGLVNITGHVSVILNYTTPVLILVNEGKNEAIGIDADSQTAVQINNLDMKNFDVLFQSITSIQALIQSGQSASLKEAIAEDASQLGIESTDPLQTITTIAKAITHLGPLKGLVRSEGHFHIAGGLMRFASVLQGLSELTAAIPGGLTSIFHNGTTLDLPAVLNATNGLEAFVKVLQSLGKGMDLSEILKHILNDPENFLRIIVQLGGTASKNNMNSILRTVYHIIAIGRSHGSIDALIQNLLDIGRHGGIDSINPPDLKTIIDDLLQLEQNQTARFNSEPLKVLIQFLQDLNNNTLIFNDINLSEIAKLLRRGNYRGAIDLAVRVLMHLRNVINPTQCISRLYGYLLHLLNNTGSGNHLPQILPGLNPSQLGNLLQGVNISQLLQSGSLPNISATPVIGEIYHSISSALREYSNGSLTLEGVLQETGGFREIFSSFGHFADPFEVFSSIQKAFGGTFDGLGLLQPLQIFGLFNNTSQDATNSSDGGNVTPSTVIDESTTVSGDFGNLVSEISSGDSRLKKKDKSLAQKSHHFSLKHHAGKIVQHHHSKTDGEIEQQVRHHEKNHKKVAAGSGF